MTKLRNLEMERMEYLRDTQKAIVDALYKDAEMLLEKLMWEIAEENRALLRCNTSTFFFNDRWWPVKRPGHYDKINSILDPSLYERVQQIIDENALENNHVRIGVETMIGNFLSIAGHVDDINELFPGSIQHCIPWIDPAIFNIKPPMSKVQIEHLLAKNKNNINYLKRLLMTQMLLVKAV